MKTSLNLLAVVLVLCAGCRTPERTVYVTVSVTARTVDAAMTSWGNYVRAGLATAKQENEVREAYAAYQQTMSVVRAAVLAWKGGAEDRTAVESALDAMEAAGRQVITLIEEMP